MADRRTRVTIAGEKWLVDGRPLLAGRMYAGRSVEGLLLNSRMVQAVFDDENPITQPLWKYPDTGRWDADRNTDEFVAALPAWREYGLAGITVNMQGGSPTGYYREESFRERLRETGIAAADLSETSLGNLTTGNADLGMPAATASALPALQNVKSLWVPFSRAVQTVLTAEAGSNEINTALAYITANNNALLTASNDAVPAPED